MCRNVAFCFPVAANNGPMTWSADPPPPGMGNYAPYGAGPDWRPGKTMHSSK